MRTINKILEVLKKVLPIFFYILLILSIFLLSYSIFKNSGKEEKDRYHIFKDNNKFGIKKSFIFPFDYILTDQIKVKAKYDSIVSFHPFYIVKDDGKKGVIRKNGDTLMSIIYENISVDSFTEDTIVFNISISACGYDCYSAETAYEDDCFKSVSFIGLGHNSMLHAGIGHKFNIASDSIEIDFLTIVSDSIEDLSADSIVYASDLIPIYHTWHSFPFFVYKNGKYDIYEGFHSTLYNTEFDDIIIDCDGNFQVCKNNKWGVLNPYDLETNIPPVYDSINVNLELPSNMVICFDKNGSVIRDVFTGDTINYFFLEPSYGFVGAKDTARRKWGFLKYDSGELISDFEYDSVLGTG